jgi:hypothetical protein
MTIIDRRRFLLTRGRPWRWPLQCDPSRPEETRLEYGRVESIAQGVDALAWYHGNARCLAGGQSTIR